MRSRHPGRIDSGLLPAFGVLLISGLWTISSLSSELLPNSSGVIVSATLRQAVLFSAFAALAATVATARHLSFPRGRFALASCSVGVGLFVLPAALESLTQGTISSLDRVAVFSLTPVLAVVLEPHMRDGPPRQGKAALAGSISAFAGILFLFPLDVPGSFRTGAALAVLFVAALGIAITNCISVRLVCTLGSAMPMAAQASATSAVCFAVAELIKPRSVLGWNALPSELLIPMAVDLSALFLLFWMMRLLAASRMTARFLITPFFTILAGIALQPSSPSERAWFGLFLLAMGAGWLVFAPAEQIGGADLESLNVLQTETPCTQPDEVSRR